eukprot:SAG31_NODE_1106_length_9878_cov_4.621331_3_plen_105_part_00
MQNSRTCYKYDNRNRVPLVSMYPCLTNIVFMPQSYVCVPLSWELRTRLTSLLKSARDSDMVYAVLFVGRRIVTYVEPRSFSLHVDDMLLLLDWMDTNLSVSVYP